MSRLTGQDIYGLFEPRYAGDAESIDKTPVRDRLPYVISADELPPFKHPPVDSHSQIRLITLLPAERPPHGSDSREPLRCNVEVHSLTQASAYEALSYTWGDLNRSLPISVVRTDDYGDEIEEALFATPQLLLALRRLRRSTSRRLWIDQLCIDQENNDEKGPQIQLMGDIYKTAWQVVIWLGEDMEHVIYEPGSVQTVEKDSEHLSTLIAAIAIKDPGPDHNAAAIATQMVDFRFTYHYEVIGMRRLRAVTEMLSRPWFRRAWVFQEASLARELVVQFGQREFPFEDLKIAFDAFHTAAMRSGMHRQTHSSLEISTAGYEMMDIIQKTRMEALENRDAPSDSTTHSRFLVKLLQVLRRVRCYKQQDLIFAFLAFQQQEGIMATNGAYEQPVEDTWRYAAEKIIQTSSSLDIFAGLSGSRSGIPSWVPNWGDCFPYSRPIAAPGSHFRASRGFAHVWEPCDDSGKLKVKGKIIDHVQDLCGPPFGVFQRYPQSVWLFLSWGVTLQWASHYLYKPEIADRLGDYLPIKQENVARDLARTLLADGALGREQPLRNVHRYVEAIVSTFEQSELRKPGRTPSESEKYLFEDCEKVDDLALVAEKKSVFYTRQIHLGMAAGATQVGDCIAILHGSKVPCILRKVEGSQNEYVAISQCYYNGWMYGQPPKEVYGKGNESVPQPMANWWMEEPDEFILV